MHFIIQISEKYNFEKNVALINVNIGVFKLKLLLT